MSTLYPGHSPSEPTSSNESMNFQLPITLLSLAAAVFFGSQIGAAYQGKSMMSWQVTNADNQIANVEKAEAQATELIKQREDLVKQATQIQTEYTNLLNSVIELAETDEDARQVVAKWKIQRSEPPKKDAAAAEEPPAGGASGTAPKAP